MRHNSSEAYSLISDKVMQVEAFNAILPILCSRCTSLLTDQVLDIRSDNDNFFTPLPRLSFRAISNLNFHLDTAPSTSSRYTPARSRAEM